MENCCILDLFRFPSFFSFYVLIFFFLPYISFVLFYTLYNIACFKRYYYGHFISMYLIKLNWALNLTPKEFWSSKLYLVLWHCFAKFWRQFGLSGFAKTATELEIRNNRGRFQILLLLVCSCVCVCSRAHASHFCTCA